MSTYAQVSDVRALAPGISIDGNSKPSEGQVQGYLDAVESEVNAVLGNLGYVTPVAATSTESCRILKDLIGHGALAKVQRARALGSDANILESAKEIERYYRDRLKALKAADDPFELPDAPRTDTAAIKGPAAAMGSFADDEYADFDEDSPRVTRAQAF